MIAGIGTDIVKIDRIRKALDRSGDRFARRILTDSEWDIFESAGLKAAWLAKRFAAKEAAAKALGTGIGKVSFQDLEVSNNDAGAPHLIFLGNALLLQEQRGITGIHLSLSDEVDFAVAFVVLETVMIP